MAEIFRVKFFGTGGSCAVSSRRRVKYGANTSCTLVRVAGQAIVLDMGTGVVPLTQELAAEQLAQVNILLGHFHYDHIEGFPFLGALFQRECAFSLYAQARGGLMPVQLLAEYMRAPFFPVTPDIYANALTCHTFAAGESFLLGAVQVDTMPLNHPNGATAYKLTFEGKSVVYMLDNEYIAAQHDPLTAFCRDAELLIWDGNFTEAEAAGNAYAGWGHSTHEQGVRLAQEAGVRRLALTHHAFWRDDAELDRLDSAARQLFPGAFLAAEGMEIIL